MDQINQDIIALGILRWKQYFYLKMMICFPFWHASQRKSSLYDSLGNPLMRSCFYSFEINLKLSCPSFLCYTQWYSFKVSKQDTFCLDNSPRLILYRLPLLLAINSKVSLVFWMTYPSLLKETLCPLSDNWLMLSRLCFSL